MHKQLTLEQRYYISVARNSGKSMRAIAKSLAVSPTTVSREIGRNSGKRGYRHKQADDLAKQRHRTKNKLVKLSDSLKQLISQPLKTPKKHQATPNPNHQPTFFTNNPHKPNPLHKFAKKHPNFLPKQKNSTSLSHFFKFHAQAAIKALISSPTCPLSKFLDNLKSALRCPMIGSMAARLLHRLRFLSR